MSLLQLGMWIDLFFLQNMQIFFASMEKNLDLLPRRAFVCCMKMRTTYTSLYLFDERFFNK